MTLSDSLSKSSPRAMEPDVADLVSRTTTLSDSELVSEVKRLARNESQATALLVASLGVLDARRLYLAEGYPSTFAYCVEALGFSEDSAYYRITAARAAMQFPVLLERLAAGVLSLKAVRLLVPHLTAENHLDLLDAVVGKSTRQVEAIIAGRYPKPDGANMLRKLPLPRARRGTGFAGRRFPRQVAHCCFRCVDRRRSWRRAE